MKTRSSLPHSIIRHPKTRRSSRGYRNCVSKPGAQPSKITSTASSDQRQERQHGHLDGGRVFGGVLHVSLLSARAGSSKTTPRSSRWPESPARAGQDFPPPADGGAEQEEFADEPRQRRNAAERQQKHQQAQRQPRRAAAQAGEIFQSRRRPWLPPPPSPRRTRRSRSAP